MEIRTKFGIKKYDIISQLNQIIDSDKYQFILKILENEKITVTSITNLNSYISIIDFNNHLNVNYYLGGIYKYYIIQDYEKLLNNGMTCIKFLCKLYRELLIYISLTISSKAFLLKYNENNEIYYKETSERFKILYNIIENLIYCKLNFPYIDISLEENFILALCEVCNKNKIQCDYLNKITKVLNEQY